MPWGDERERTEPATGRKREEARRKGQVAVSHELNSAAVLIGGILFLFLAGGALLEALRALLVQSFTENLAAGAKTGLALKATGELFEGTFSVCFPLYAGVLTLALLLNFLQTGFLVATEKIRFDWNKINPLKGLQNLFSLRALVKLLFSVTKLMLIGIIIALTVRQKLPLLLSLHEKHFAEILSFGISLVFLIFFRVGLAFLVVGIADLAYQHWQMERDLMMTKEELKEEQKRTEGDPAVRRRIRQVQRERAMKRMLQDVKKAKVVVTNPNRFAVALAYEQKEMEAPRVVAKGMNLIADRIRKIAFRRGIPIVENKPLARTLFRTVEVGSQIPPALYRAVAEVLSYVHRLRGRL